MATATERPYSNNGLLIGTGAAAPARSIAALTTGEVPVGITGYPPVPVRVTFPVAAWGAVGDGVTDDTTAINAAITAASAAGGGVVTFPPGVYMASQIVLKTGVLLDGGTLGGGDTEADRGEQLRLHHQRTIAACTGIPVPIARLPHSASGSKRSAIHGNRPGATPPAGRSRSVGPGSFHRHGVRDQRRAGRTSIPSAATTTPRSTLSPPTQNWGKRPPLRRLFGHRVLLDWGDGHGWSELAGPATRASPFTRHRLGAEQAPAARAGMARRAKQRLEERRRHRLLQHVMCSGRAWSSPAPRGFGSAPMSSPMVYMPIYIRSKSVLGTYRGGVVRLGREHNFTPGSRLGIGGRLRGRSGRSDSCRWSGVAWNASCGAMEWFRGGFH